MRFRSLAFIFIVILASSIAFGQTPAQAEKKKKELDERVVQMLDQAITEGGVLRVPQNRSIVYAMSGDLYWRFDPKRSRELFRNSAAEIISHNAETEREKRESTDLSVYGLFDPGDIRQEIMPLIARCDPELALELLFATRTAILADAIARLSQPRADDDLMTFNPETQAAGRELALEQQIALLVADENPEAVIKLIKDRIAKGTLGNVLQLLQKVHTKDEKKAAELASEVIKKLIDADLAQNQEDFRAAVSLLRYAAQPAPAASSKNKPFIFAEAQIKELANRVVVVLLQPARSMSAAMSLTQAMSILEKLVPERIALLRQRAAENERSLPLEFKSMQRRQKLYEAGSTPEYIIGQLSKMSETEKMTAYQTLLSKIGQIRDEARARKLIDQIPDESARAVALEQFESARIARIASTGKVDEARRLIGSLTNKKMQVQRLVALALQIHTRDAETAASIMVDARSLTNDFPEDEDDLANLMEVVKGYTTIEPDIAFRLFEPVIEQFNEMLQASAVLSKYNKRDRTFRRGELVMKMNGNSGGPLLFRYIPQMQLLGKADLERMSILAGRFGRSDSRTIVRLHVLQGFMRDDKKTTGAASGAGVIR